MFYDKVHSAYFHPIFDPYDEDTLVKLVGVLHRRGLRVNGAKIGEKSYLLGFASENDAWDATLIDGGCFQGDVEISVNYHGLTSIQSLGPLPDGCGGGGGDGAAEQQSTDDGSPADDSSGVPAASAEAA